MKVFLVDDLGRMRRCALDNPVKVLFGRSGVACGGLLRTISKVFYLNDPGQHVDVCSG